MEEGTYKLFPVILDVYNIYLNLPPPAVHTHFHLKRAFLFLVLGHQEDGHFMNMCNSALLHSMFTLQQVIIEQLCVDL